tara:strand:- start:306 stop:899 length:594 start_codon:yes stop_codon:yes gene_type:complete
MKRLLLILILTFGFQSWTRAGDIGEFEVDGVSIGDSALDYVDKNFIEENKFYYPNSKKYGTLSISPPDSKLIDFKTFDNIQLSFIDTDSNYKIHSVRGKILYKKGIDMKNCDVIKKDVMNDVEQMFKIKKVNDDKENHPADKSGKSKTNAAHMYFEGGKIGVSCLDWHIDMTYWDNFSVAILNEEFSSWLNNEAFKN